MESSIPLLGVKYLPWRATLYTATCQCYYDCKYIEDGEVIKGGGAKCYGHIKKKNKILFFKYFSMS